MKGKYFYTFLIFFSCSISLSKCGIFVPLLKGFSIENLKEIKNKVGSESWATIAPLFVVDQDDENPLSLAQMIGNAGNQFHAFSNNFWKPWFEFFEGRKTFTALNTAYYSNPRDWAIKRLRFFIYVIK